MGEILDSSHPYISPKSLLKFYSLTTMNQPKNYLFPEYDDNISLHMAIVDEDI